MLLNRTYCWVTAWDGTQEIVIQFHKSTQALTLDMCVAVLCGKGFLLVWVNELEWNLKHFTGFKFAKMNCCYIRVQLWARTNFPWCTQGSSEKNNACCENDNVNLVFCCTKSFLNAPTVPQIVLAHFSSDTTIITMSLFCNFYCRGRERGNDKVVVLLCRNMIATGDHFQLLLLVHKGELQEWLAVKSEDFLCKETAIFQPAQ